MSGLPILEEHCGDERPVVRGNAVDQGPPILGVGYNALPWSPFEAWHHGARTSIQQALDEVCSGIFPRRFTHVYPDGPATYYLDEAGHEGRAANLGRCWSRRGASVSLGTS